MYRAIPSRRQVENPLRNLVGLQGAIGAIYSTYSRPIYNCAPQAVKDKARVACQMAKNRGDSFVRKYGIYPKGSGRGTYIIGIDQVTSGRNTVFDPCDVQNANNCPATPPPVPVVPPQVTSAPPKIPDDPIVVIDEPVFEEEPVAVFDEHEEEEKVKKDDTSMYVVGGIVLLVAGGGLAYYLVTKGKKKGRR